MNDSMSEELRSRIADLFMAEITASVVEKTPVDKGYMKIHWHERKVTPTQIELSNNTSYLPFHITGTGLYGPKHQMICATGMSKTNPHHLHVMAWRPKGGGEMMFRRCIKGIRPNSFVDDGIEAGIVNAIGGIGDLIRRNGNLVLS